MKRKSFQFGMNRRHDCSPRCSTLQPSAGANGMAGIQEATQMVTSYFGPGDQADLRHRRRHRPDWRSAGLSEVQFGRSDTSKTAASWFEPVSS